MERSPNLDLPFIMPSQAQKHVTHNEALTVLDALVHCAVETRSLAEPPPSPVEGRRYLVAGPASHAWVGKEGRIAVWAGGEWCFYPPQAGMIIFVTSESLLLLYDGLSFRPPLTRTEWLGVNTDADEQNRFAVAGASTLLTHDGADHRLAVNKAETTDTASMVFQDNYSGRAEVGLAGDDRLSLKVSSDGENWIQALAIDPVTGHIGVHSAPDSVARLAVSGGVVRLGTHLISSEEAGGGPAMEIGYYGSGDRPAYFDFHADDEWTDFASRFIRWGGRDGSFTVYNRGVGGIDFHNMEAGPVRFYTSSQVRMTVNADGNVAIGVATPTAALHVGGVVRVGSVAAVNLPSADLVGAGSLVWVSDADNDGALVFSNGITWRKVADGGPL